LGSGGAYCIGSRKITEHQRLASTGYCFSAASPPYFSTAALEAIRKIDETPKLMQQVSSNATIMERELKAKLPKKVSLSSSAVAIPIFHIKLADATIDVKKSSALMTEIAAKALKQGVAVVASKYNERDRAQPAPSVRLTVSANHTEADIKQGVQILASVIEQVVA